MSESTAPTNPARARLKLLLLMIMPMAVVLAATFVFFTKIGMPEGTRNKGTLITPPLQLMDMRLRNDKGDEFKLDAAKEKMWLFLVAAPAQCDEVCRQRFWEVRQTRVALGKYQSHIRRVWLVTEGEPDSATRDWLLQEHKDMALIYSGSSEWQRFITQHSVAADSVAQARFYLVDPQGFVMMYYRAEDTYKDVIKDIKFLLKGVE
jgi:cytochrome oxidase Cu insertion factor (SCO1/SenC/PrrC family)